MLSGLGFGLAARFFRLESSLRRELGRDATRRLIERTRAHHRIIDERTPAAGGEMRVHRSAVVTGLALYRAMQDELDVPDEVAVDVVHRVLWRSGIRDATGTLAFIVRHSRDPFARFLRLLGPRNERLFPCPPWEKVEVDLPGGVGWEQTRCPIHEFLRDEGAGELTRAYCDLDQRIVELVPDHVELRRRRTLAQGDSGCDFLYLER